MGTSSNETGARSNRRAVWAWVAAFALVGAQAASAAFHLILIVEVFVGSTAAPDAQYVVLEMYDNDQTVLGSHPMRFFDENEASLGTASFGTISNGDINARILIATSSAEALFGITADLRVPAKMPAAGGKVCFDTIDCFAWGSYAPADATVGTPFSDFDGLAAATRMYTVPLDASDDTNDSELDFQSESAPTPRNNSGDTGSRNFDALFLHGFENAGLGGWSVTEAGGE